MEWYWYLIINICVFSLATVYQRSILKHSKDPALFYVVNGLVAGSILLAHGLWVGFKIPNIQDISLNLIAMTVLLGFGNLLNFNALKKVDASEFTVLFSTRAIWSVLAAVLVLGESFGPKQIIGAALIISSVFLVSWKKKSFRLNEGEMLTLAAAAFFGLEFINDTYLLNRVDLLFYIPLIFLFPALAVAAVNFKKLPTITRVVSFKDFLKLSFLGLLFAVSATATLTAYQVGHNAAQIAILNQTSTIVIVFLGIIFLNERSHMKLKILGAVISLIGVFLVK
jgi:drug/metabolite transporter (DMT)-like permease